MISTVVALGRSITFEGGSSLTSVNGQSITFEGSGSSLNLSSNVKLSSNSNLVSSMMVTLNEYW